MMLVGQQLGPFAIDKELGSGAMGTVYRGVYAKTGQKVAIKVMLPGMGTSDRANERFEREAAILKQFNHPNIVRMFGVGRFQGTRYYAMEYIEGETLDKVMGRRGRISWEEVAEMGKQLCAALQHAHERGVIHRDLKPANLMVLPDGTLKLTDFGIAKDLDVTALTATNCTVGTASYMSPEQCRGERDLTNKSDLYSLGVLFYELITGRKPFNADNALEMFMQHVEGTFERPSKIVLDLPIWFDNLICQLLEKKPEHRPLDAATVSRALDDIAEKVEAMKSAGVVAARKRRADRTNADRDRDRTETDDADREAARLLAGKKKKKKKKEGQPLYQQVWAKAAALSLLLLLVVGAIVWKFQPKSAEQLYKEAEKGMASNDPAKWEEARNGPIKEYLERFDNNPGPQTEQMRAWAERYDVWECGQIVQTMLTTGKKVASAGAKNDAEKDALAAARAEEEGKLDDARRLWDEAAKKWDKGSGYAAWGRYAAWRLSDVDQMNAAEAEMKAKWENWAGDKLGRGGPEPKYEGPRQRAFLGLRYAWRKDPFAALEQFEEMRAKYKDDAENRVWFLLAVKQVEDLKKQTEKIKEQIKDDPDGKKVLARRQEEVRGLVDVITTTKGDKAWKEAVARDLLTLYDGREGFEKLKDELAGKR